MAMRDVSPMYDDGGEDVQDLDELVGGCRYDVALAVQCLVFFGV